MKVIKDLTRPAGAIEKDGRSVQEIVDRLDSVSPPGQLANILGLARELEAHTPRSYFQNLPAEKVAGWIADLFAFLDRRSEPVALHLAPGDRSGQWYLLTNTPDAPFLVDSLQALLNRLKIRFQIVSHPILSIRRQRGRIVSLDGTGGEGAAESLILVELQGVQEKVRLALPGEIARVFSAVLQVDHDQRKLSASLRKLEKLPGAEEVRDFWHWLQSGNFLPFGYRCWTIRNPRGEARLELAGPPLGVFPGAPDLSVGDALDLSQVDRDFQRRLLRPERVVAESTREVSPVHRSDRLNYLGWREELADGNWQEHAFSGLFSQKFLEEPTFSIAPLRRKIEKALAELGIPKGSHDYNKTIEIFNTFPKVELFFMEADELREAVRSFTFLYRQGAVKVVITPSLSVKGLTLLLILPREFYNRENLERLEAYIRRFFQAEATEARIIHISADYLSLHVTVSPLEKEGAVDLDRLEQGLTEIARPWEMKLHLLLESRLGEELGNELFARYIDGFTDEYRTLTHPRFALRDIQGMEEVRRSEAEYFNLWGPFHNDEEYYRLQFYSRHETYLNALMPLLENLHLCVIDELDFMVREEQGVFYIKSFAIKNAVAHALALGDLREKLLAILSALRQGRVENDNLNRLLVLTGLDWREIDVFRGYRNYYHQLGSPFTKRRIAYALIQNPHVARLLFRYFEARFLPEEKWRELAVREEQALSPLRMELAEALEQVSDINEDRILRTLFNLIDSTVRTNFFQRRQEKDYFFSFKISAIGIIDMPAPRPLYEIYVHGAEMEGIHLRGGKVARGGIRWSDRPDDFRTEILGLMKTQMTKNALIVPVGSKGGFVVQRPFTTRDEGAQLSKKAYVTLMRGLLDLTDNRVDGRVVRPEGIVAYDEEDPYLVVAADKGTAHLPDTANAVSKDYRFWLDDAFASGGSQGYDHKALGITARGAWECVKRHFREMGIDIQSEPFTVVGIGDMSGDVFGNGMLLSRQIRLLAAFDHRHIFLDPDPDPERTFRERERLFALPRSSWDDYDRSLISAGGGIFPRQAKDIPLSPEVRTLLGVRHASVDGQDLVRLILRARADLLWNGGIGTYVKATTEKHEDVGDRSNDGVRIDTSQLRVQVIGEGGNLGLTQKARIEFALAGGRINTDAIDNSAGVDCSDHEVNLKIFMQHLAESGRVVNEDERDRLLREVTDDVCAAVLGNNYTQSLGISLDLRRCAQNCEPYLQLIDRLVNAGLLDRAGEFLPLAKEVLARPDKALVRPELAILLAYSKMQLYQALLEGSLLEDRTFAPYFESYFPRLIREKFAGELARHPLAREITATVLTNTVIDIGGCSRMSLLMRQSGRPLAQCAAAFLAFDRILDGAHMRASLFALDNRIDAGRQYDLIQRYGETLERICLWALDEGLEVSLDEDSLADWQGRIGEFINLLPGVLPAEEWKSCTTQTKELVRLGLAEDHARLLVTLDYLADLLPLAALVEKTGRELHTVICTYRDLRKMLEIERVRRAATAVPLRDRWDRMAFEAFDKDLVATLFELTGAVLRENDGNVERYLSRRRQKYRLAKNLWQQIEAEEPMNFNPFAVLGRAFSGLI